MRDLHSNLTVSKTLSPQVITSDTTIGPVDRQGYDSVEHVVVIGVSPDTLSGTRKFDFKIEHSDESNANFVAAAEADVLGTAPDADGIWHTVDADAEDDVVAKIGYVGDKRYSRVICDVTGTHSTGTAMSAVAILGHAAQKPVA